MDMSDRSDHGGGVGGHGSAPTRPEYHFPSMGTITVNSPKYSQCCQVGILQLYWCCMRSREHVDCLCAILH